MEKNLLDSSQPGGNGAFPVFPRRGEPWLECTICGFAFPRSEMTRNYRTNRFVDFKCDDQLNHDDYMQYLPERKERPEPSEQRVSDQGPAFESVGGGYGGPYGGEYGNTYP